MSAQSLMPTATSNTHPLFVYVDPPITRPDSLEAQIADLSLKVFIPLQKIRSDALSFSWEDLRFTFPWRYSSFSDDFYQLERLLYVIQNHPRDDISLFLRHVSYCFDTLSVYKMSITDRFQEVFPWKMFSYLAHCSRSFSEEYPSLMKHLHQSEMIALDEALPLLKAILMHVKCREQKESLELEYYQELVRNFYTLVTAREDEDPVEKYDREFSCRVANFPQLEEMEIFTRRRLLTFDEKTQKCRKILEAFPIEDLAKVKTLEKMQEMRMQCEELQRQLARKEREIQRLAKKSNILKVGRQIGAFYELENLCIATRCANAILHDSQNTEDSLLQLLVLLRESTKLTISDLSLNVKQRDSVKTFAGLLTQTRDFFEHPEDYFLQMSVRGELEKQQEFQQMKIALWQEMGEVVHLMEIRVDKIKQLMKPHPQKISQDIFEALTLPPPESQAFSKREYAKERFPRLFCFAKKILHKKDFRKKDGHEKQKLQPFLYDLHPSAQTSPLELKDSLFHALEDLKRHFIKLDRLDFSQKLAKNLSFRLSTQRKIAVCYRLMEEFFTWIKKEECPPDQYKLLEEAFYAARDVRNFQTHDLWRENVLGIVNTSYLLVYDFLEVLRILHHQHYEEDSLEVSFIQEIRTGHPSLDILEKARALRLDIHAFDYKHRSFLIFLAKRPSETNFAIAARLIELGVNIHLAEYTRLRPLHVACQSGFFDLVKLLVSKGAVVDIPSAEGTPIEIAQKYGHPEIAQFLASQAGITRKSEARAVLDAVKSQNVEGLTRLLRAGYSPLIDFEGELPFVSLFRMEYIDPQLQLRMANLLLDSGATINQQEIDSKQTALHAAAKTVYDKERIEFLMALNPDVNLRDQGRETPLHHAVICHNEFFVERLLQKGAHCNVKCSIMNWTPLLAACEINRFSSKNFVLLLQHGADPNVRDSVGAPLHCLAEHNNRPLVELALKAGASPFVRRRGFGRAFPYEVTSSFEVSQVLKEWMQYFFSHASP